MKSCVDVTPNDQEELLRAVSQGPVSIAIKQILLFPILQKRCS